MFDDYSLRLLAEMGVDVYVPLAVSEEIVAEPATAAVVSLPPSIAKTSVTDVAAQRGPAPDASLAVDVLILCEQRQPERLLHDLLRALRAAKVSADFGLVDDLTSISSAHGLVVLGESLARTIGPGLSAQQQNALTWVVAAEPNALVGNASAKRALWGEIKRLSRALSSAHRSA